jgi:transmembrane sensor
MQGEGWAAKWWALLRHAPTCGNFVLFGAQAYRSAEHSTQFLALSESQPEEPGPLIGAVIAVRSILYWLSRRDGSGAFTRHLSASGEWWFASLRRNPTPRNCTLFGACAERSEALCEDFLGLCDSAEHLEGPMAEIADAVRAIHARLRLEKAMGGFDEGWSSGQRARRIVVPAVGLCVGFAVVVGGSLWLQARAERASWQTIATKTGEHRHVEFPDGSRADVNTETVLRYRFTGSLRALELVSGEVRIRAAHEKRPLALRARDMSIVDIGTEFTTRLRDNGDVEVRVIDGEVGLDPTPPGLLQDLFPGSRVRTSYSVRVRAGYIARNQGGKLSVTAADASELERRDAWRFGKIEMNGMTVEEAVSELNRYNQEKIVISDPTLTSLLLGGGSYDARRPEDFLNALSRVIPMRVTTTHPANGDGEVYQLHRAK